MLFLAVFFSAVVVMEPFAWALHKYAFHGPLWFLHESHHVPAAAKPAGSWRLFNSRRWRVEANDAFGLVFAIIAIGFMCARQAPPLESLSFAFGLGVTAYGFLYFLVHDSFVHRRFFVIGPCGRWLEHVREAHRFHHRSLRKTATGPFGLFVPFDYAKSESRGRVSQALKDSASP